MSAVKKLPKKILLIAVAVLLILLAGFNLLKINPITPQMPPADLCSCAIENLLSLDSLSFHTDTELIINEENVKLGKIDGEICGKDLHIRGNVLGSDLNIYQIGGTCYRQDTISEQWLTTEDTELLTNESLLSDANPRAFFKLAGLGDVTEGEIETIDEEKCRKLTFTPKTADGYWEKYFDEISCTIWVTQDNNQIRQAQICAVATAAGHTSTLCLTTEFWNWNETAAIEPPIVTPAA